jgi:GNAT superfamily N-acetyltransferase
VTDSLPVTTEMTTDTPRAVTRIGPALVLASILASTLGIVIAQFLDDLGDGILAEILGGDAILYNNRVDFTGASDLAWAGGFVLCLLVGLLALFVYPTQRGHGVPRLVLLWMLLHVMRQALTQAVMLPFDGDSQLALAFGTFDAPPGLDFVIAAGGAVGLLLVALAAAAAFLAFTPHQRLVRSGRQRFLFALWIALIPAVVSTFGAIPYFLPDSEGLVLAGLPLTAVIFLATLAAAPGTTTVIGPEDERVTPWPWGLAVFMLVLLIFFLGVLQGGVSIDPRAWGTEQ